MILFGRGSLIGFLTKFLALTSVLWAPQEWLYWLQLVLLTSDNPTWVDVDTLIGSDPAGPCLTREEKRNAISGSAEDVSGWYGPGAYLAWLVTANVASISAIWNAEQQRARKQKEMEGELLAALMYPTIAMLDLLYRFIRCKVDPTLNASMLVIIASLVTLGSARRLEWRLAYSQTVNVEDDMFPSGPRAWTMSVFLVLCHTVLWATLGEPYLDIKLFSVLYSLAIVVLMYSEIRVETLKDVYPYRTEEFRPRHERIAVFILVQVVFLIVLGTTQHSIFPSTGSKLSDLDQMATLLTVLFATIFSRTKRIFNWIQNVRRRSAGFSRLSPPEDMEL